MDFVTQQMEESLQRLQTVKSFDYARAYEAAYTGISVIDPRSVRAARELIYGRSLALRVWKDRCSATLEPLS